MTSRPRISWSDLAGASVGLWGLGVEGQASLRRLQRQGIEPTLVDDHPSAEHLDELPVLRTDQDGLDALRRCDVVIKSPGISRYRPEVATLRAHGSALTGGLGLWMEEVDPERVLCITGTKGKSTTAAIAGHLLERLGYRPLVAGNIGRPPFDPDVGDDVDYWVIEVSSFQATDLASSSPVVAVTSLHPDHLDWHGDAATYFADKLSACTQVGAHTTVADGGSALLRAHESLLGPRVEWIDDDTTLPSSRSQDGPWHDALRLLGRHNLRNADIARAALVALGIPEAADDEAIANAATGFVGLDSRLQRVESIDGVTFVDDGLSTNVLPTLVALDAFPDRRVAVIVGGFDRGIDYTPLAEGFSRRPHTCVVVTHTAAGRRIGSVITEGPSPRPEMLESPDLATATRVAFEWARPDGVVLLSPAAPSFGEYRDYRARGTAFLEAARSCATR